MFAESEVDFSKDDVTLNFLMVGGTKAGKTWLLERILQGSTPKGYKKTEGLQKFKPELKESFRIEFAWG